MLNLIVSYRTKRNSSKELIGWKSEQCFAKAFFYERHLVGWCYSHQNYSLKLIRRVLNLLNAESNRNPITRISID